MTPAELELKGQLLYGRQWQSALAENVGVNSETVTNWKFGRQKIKPKIEKKINDLLAKRELMIRSLIATESGKEHKIPEKCRQHAA